MHVFVDAKIGPALTLGLFFTLGASASAVAAPQIESWQTENGAKVLFVDAPDLPMLDLRIVFDAGSARDGDKPGLSSLTADMLTEGAADLDADAIAERVEAVGAQLGTGADRDMAWATLRSLTDEALLEPAVDTLTKVLAQPGFPADDFERVRQNRLVALRLAEQDPGSVGSKLLYRTIFGEHPYGSDPSGTADSVGAMTRDDLAAFHGKYYAAPNATLAIVGALSRAEAEQLANRVTAGLPSGSAAPPLPAVPELTAGSLKKIDFPSSQTHIYAGQPGMARGDPDYFPLYVGNHILGGSGLVSILMYEVREKRGLSYSTYSYFAPMAVRGPMIMGLQTKNAQADEASAVLLDTVQRFIEQGPTDEELDAALKNITGGFPLRIASNSKVVQYLAMIGFYDLPLDYLDRFVDRVSAVSSEQIRDAFSRRVHPDRLAVVAVGGDSTPVAETATGEGTEPGANAGGGTIPAAAATPGAAQRVGG
ncbi:MAG: pitrilysin family protein [Thiohalocapsa sp.]